MEAEQGWRCVRRRGLPKAATNACAHSGAALEVQSVGAEYRKAWMRAGVPTRGQGWQCRAEGASRAEGGPNWKQGWRLRGGSGPACWWDVHERVEGGTTAGGGEGAHSSDGKTVAEAAPAETGPGAGLEGRPAEPSKAWGTRGGGGRAPCPTGEHLTQGST